ncbi:MAG: ribosome biogenesis GTPase Der [Arsenophonus sp.]|nr:MAG: ribosome biogenesis GTPase Der [Arsenophonus sp.]
MSIKIALIGATNVGKSTFFNLLTNREDFALISNYPNFTRDRKYGFGILNKKKYVVIDTGPIDFIQNGLNNKINAQSFLAIQESDLIFFIVDAQLDLTNTDKMIANYLKKIPNKKIYLFISKINNLNVDLIFKNFGRLGFKNIYLLYQSKLRMRKIFKKILINEFKETFFERKNFLIKKKNILESNLLTKIIIVGKQNVGKSTFTNFIYGGERVIVYDLPGTTRDLISIYKNRKNFSYVFTDTPGIRKIKKNTDQIEKKNIFNILKKIKKYNIILLMIDSEQGITNQDLSLLQFIIKQGNLVIIVFNKWDKIKKKYRKDYKRKVEFKLKFIFYIKVYYISSVFGNGIKKLLSFIYNFQKFSNIKINSSNLTKIFFSIQKKHSFFYKKRRIKIKYAHIGKMYPLTIIIHGNKVEKISDVYKRYLTNSLIKVLNINIPVFLEFKNSQNPFLIDFKKK